MSKAKAKSTIRFPPQEYQSSLAVQATHSHIHSHSHSHVLQLDQDQTQTRFPAGMLIYQALTSVSTSPTCQLSLPLIVVRTLPHPQSLQPELDLDQDQ